MTKTQVKMRACQTTKSEATILYMLERFSSRDTLSFRNLVGATFLRCGSPKILSIVVMWLSRCRKVHNTIWRQPMMKLKFWTKLQRIGDVKNGNLLFKNTIRKIPSLQKNLISMEWVETLPIAFNYSTRSYTMALMESTLLWFSKSSVLTS